MKTPPKPSIALPSAEVRLVNGLTKKLKAKSEVEVIERGSELHSNRMERESLAAQYRMVVRQIGGEAETFDDLADAGLD